MDKEIITEKQGILLIVLFIIDGALMIPVAIEAQKDLWLAIILSILVSLFFVIIYSKILMAFKGKDLFDILEHCYGKLVGKSISLLYVWFSFHLASLVLRDFSSFFNTVTLPETPQAILIIFPGLICMWIVKEGIEVLGRIGEILSKINFFAIIIIATLLISHININNIRPVLYNGIKPVINGVFSVFTFPLGETVIFTMVISSIRKKNKIMKVYVLGLIIGGGMLLFTNTIDFLVLGYNTYSSLVFPGYTAISRISIGTFLQRIEIVTGLIFIMFTFIKLSVCVFVASKGISKIFNLKDYRFIVSPLVLSLINLTYLQFDSVMEALEWSGEIYRYYAIPFEVLIPLITFILIKTIKKPSIKNDI